MTDARESLCRERLRAYLTALGWPDVEKSAEDMLALSSGFEERFAWLDRFVSAGAKGRLLVSGCAVGSELLVARAHGFGEVHGTDVDPQLFAIAETRLAGDPGFRLLLCSGIPLAYPDAHFDAVVSGHVIEHSRAPLRYLAEHLRVLRPGGVLFLEFPHRYHPVELHTGTRSFEWLPWPLRDAALRARALKWRRRDPKRARLSDSVRIDLRPVSLWQVRTWLRLLPRYRARVVEASRPVPGIVRAVVRRAA